MERVQKIIARAGIASRREAETLIRDGLVTINGKPAKLGDQAESGKDSIKVRGKLLQLNQPRVYIAFHKPKGVISAMKEDPQGRRTLAPYFNKLKLRLNLVGRMDYNSEGLLLLTNDGEMAEKIQKHPQIPRIYHVKIKGHPDAATVSKLMKPARIEFKSVKPHSVRVISTYTQKSLLEIIMIGQTGADVKAFVEKRGHLVERVIRNGIGQINLHGLEPGDFKYLKKSQIEALVEHPDLVLRRAVEPTKPPPKSLSKLVPKPVPKPLSKA
jgi:23S rRNA pseudouridine2605 synthase